VVQDFYKLDRGLVEAMDKKLRLSGSILILLDSWNVINDTLQKNKAVTFIHQNTYKENLLELDWWKRQNQTGYDYVVAPTIGLKDDVKSYILEYGVQVVKEGLILLDRLSFLEPTHNRRDFLKSYKLSSMLVLHPRPNYRAVGSAKDSVTSCWFEFRKPKEWLDGTNIEYVTDWEYRGGVSKLPPLV
jgi:hypothetical protein